MIIISSNSSNVDGNSRTTMLQRPHCTSSSIPMTIPLQVNISFYLKYYIILLSIISTILTDYFFLTLSLLNEVLLFIFIYRLFTKYSHNSICCYLSLIFIFIASKFGSHLNPFDLPCYFHFNYHLLCGCVLL